MKIACIHCGNEFSISADDLGGKGRCPHCKGEISLPKPEAEKPPAPTHRQSPTGWLDSSFSGLASLVIHLVAFLLVALVQAQGGTGGAGRRCRSAFFRTKS
jgi:predicted Zn finger-like uncharacterized protein